MSELKICGKCKQPKALDEFYKDSSRRDGRAYQCIACKKLHDQSPGRKSNHRAAHLKTRFNMTPKQKEEMFESQGRKCAACPRTDPIVHDWHVDHDHSCCPGKVTCGECVRGLLCHHCNVALGYLEDSPERVLMLYKYAARTRSYERKTA